ncbi:MAG: S8 family serine peptidase [Lentisphaerae bacterium]|nr:S8 family serine peptidase [Lentisphaerota bacterium]
MLLSIGLAVPASRAQDLDGDGLTDPEELFLGTATNTPDTDDDGVPELHEILGDPTGSGNPDTQYITHPLYSMGHYDLTLTNVLGQVLTPPRSLDLAVPASTATTWTGIQLPGPGRYTTLGGGNGWTLETWVRPSTDLTGTLIAYRLTNGLTSAEIGLTNGYAYARFQTAGGITFMAGGLTAGNLPLVADRWQYVAGVWDPETRSISLYVNDAKFAKTALLQPTTGTGRMYLGGVGTNTASTVLTSGMMDEVRIWRRARTADDLRLWRSKFLQVSPSVPSQLRGYFRFDDAGLTIQDFSSTVLGLNSILPTAYNVLYTPFPNSYGLTNFSDVGTSTWVPTQNALNLEDIDDADLDLLPDWWESLYGIQPDIYGVDNVSLDPFTDIELDGLSNLYEFRTRTNPFDLDTDNDGVADSLEDLDSDGLNNAGEERWLTDPQQIDSDDDGWTDRQEVDRGTSPRHPMSRPDYASASFDASTNPSPATGVAIPESSRFQFGGSAWTIETWYYPTQADITGDIFTYVGLNGESFRMGLTNGVPIGQIYSGAGIIASVGGTNTVPPLQTNEWQHLAISFSPSDNTFRLFRDGFLLIAQITLARPNIVMGDAYLGRGLTAGYVDELRVWAEARSGNELERWQHDLVPSFEIVDAGPFSGFLYTQELLPVAPPAPVDGYWPTIYKYTDLMRLYYRFDDGGPMVEDFSHFQDRTYYLTAAPSTNGAAPLLGVDDADGDGVSDWWVDLHNLSHWLDRYHGTAVDTRKDLDVDGDGAPDPTGWLDGNQGPWTEPPLPEFWPIPEADVGYIIRDFVCFGSFGGSALHEENFEYVDAKSRILHDSGKYVALVKYFMLPVDPTTATFSLRIDAGRANDVRVNGTSIPLTGTGSNVVTSLLHKGRNQIFILAEDTAGAVQTMQVTPPGTWRYNQGGDPPQFSDEPWPPQTFTWPLLTMKIDSGLVVDGQEIIVRGDKTKFDPRSVWHGRVSTDQALIRYADTVLRLPEHPDFGIELDSDLDKLSNYSELLTGSNPKDKDSDNNGIPDSDEDFDSDSLGNLQEDQVGSDPRLSDTDDDWLGDALEIAQGNNPVDGNSPPINRAARCDGSGYVELPKQRRFALDSWTVEMRIRPSAPGGRLLERNVGAVGGTGLPLVNYGLRLTSSNTVVAYFSDIVGRQIALESKAPILVTGSNWTHVAATYDLTTRKMSLFVDAQPSAALSTNNNPVTYGPGGATVRAGAGYVGLLDEVRIWNFARTQGQIEGTWRATLSGQEAGLVGYYRFDDGGLTAQDSLLSSRADWTTGWRNAATLNGFTNESFTALSISDLPLDADSDNDGLPDWWEIQYGLDPFDPSGDNGAFGDPDGDGLWNISEFQAQLNPSNASTFNDGVTDGFRDSDGDGLSNRYEQDNAGTRLDMVDTDDDNVTDWEEVTGHRVPGGWTPVVNATHTLIQPSAAAAPGPISNPLRSTDPLQHRSGYFDGTGALVVGQQDRHALSSWTLEAWIKPAAGSDGVVITRVVTNTLLNAQAINYEIGVTTNTAGAVIPYARYIGFTPGTTNRLEVRVDGRGASEVMGGALTTMELQPEIWTHLAGTYDQENHILSVYLNGELASYRRDAFSPWGIGVIEGQAFQGEVMVGGYRSASGDVTQGFEGSIDEAMIIGGVATAKSVRQSATEGLPMRSALLATSRTPPSGPRQLPLIKALSYEHTPTDILVRFRDNITPAQVSGVAQALGTSVVRSYQMVPVHLVKVSDGSTLEQKLSELRANPNVSYAEPNYKIKGSRTPNDPSLTRQWGMQNTGQTGGTPDADVDAPTAWDRGTGSREVTVAVLDSGVSYTHNDLAANIWTNEGEIAGNNLDDDGDGYVDDVYGYDFFNNDGDPVDDFGHGTHVAGIIAAQGDNGIGVVGMNWRAQIMGLKFIGAANYGTMDGAVAAIDFAISKGVRISNNSWGAYGFSQALYDAIAMARARNHLFVAAAGNEGVNIDEYPEIPAGYDLDNILSVAASDHNDQLASFSNYGLKNVDIAAPGVSIYSTMLNNSFGNMSGTSMAAPHVTGAAALLLSLYPNISYESLKLTLLNSADEIDAFSGLMQTGGRLNTGAAVTGTGIMLMYLPFDDGGSLYDNGESVEDFTVAQDWNNAWSSAGRFVGGASFSTNSYYLSGKDSNGDGIPDWWAEAYGFDPRGSSIANADADGDGVKNYTEYLAGTHPQMADSDGNGTQDADEDPDGDGLTTLQEQTLQTHPLRADTDDDGVSDGVESHDGTNPLNAYSPEHTRALVLDGSHRLRVRRETSASMVADWSVEAWVRPAASNQTGIVVRRAEKTPYRSQRRVDYELGLTDGVPYVSYAFRSGGTLVVERVTAPWTVDGGTWVHLAGVRDATNNQLRLFVDGKRVAYKRAATIPSQTAINALDTLIGGGDVSGSSVASGFAGALDAVRIWSYARTGLEIQGTRSTVLPEYVGGEADALRSPTHLFNFDDGGAYAENSRYSTNWVLNWADAAEVEGSSSGAVSNYLEDAAFPPVTFDVDDDTVSDETERGRNWLVMRSENPYTNRFLHFSNTGSNTVYVDELVDNDNTLQFATTNWTVSTWARLGALPSSMVPLVRRRLNDGGWVSFELGVRPISGKARAYARFNRADGSHAMVTLVATNDLPIGPAETDWVHLAATFKDGRFALDVNGRELTFLTLVGATPMMNGPGKLEIGGPGLLGDLQEIRIWKVPLSDTEVASTSRRTLLFSSFLLEQSYLADGENAYLARPTQDSEDGYVYDYSTTLDLQGVLLLTGRVTHKFAVESWVKMEKEALGGIIAERKIDVGLLPDQPDWRINHSLRVTGNGEPQGIWEGQVEVATPIYDASNNLTRVDVNIEHVRRNITSEVDIRDGKWHHLALVGDSLVVRLYIDGILDKQSLSYYVFRARPAPTFETFYGTYPPVKSVLRVADEGIQAILDEVMFWNESITEAQVRQHMEFGLDKRDIKAGLSTIVPLPEFSVDDGQAHHRLVSYLTFDGGVDSPFIPDVGNVQTPYRMTPLPAGNELVSLTDNVCPVKVDRLRSLERKVAGLFTGTDGGRYLENYMQRNDQDHAGLLGTGVSFVEEPVLGGGDPLPHIYADSDDDGMPDWWEAAYRLDPAGESGDYAPTADPDGDGLNNLYEYLSGADPWNHDADSDMVTDAAEDADGDGLTNLREQTDTRTNPQDADTDDDTRNDGTELSGATASGGRYSTAPLYSGDPRIARSLVLTGTAVKVPEPLRFDVTVNEESQQFERLSKWVVACQVRPTGTQTGALVVRRTLTGGVTFELRLDANVPTVRFTSSMGTVVSVTAPQAIPANAWSALMGVWSPDEHSLTLYVDEAPVARLTTSESCATGHGTTLCGEGVVGRMDDLYIGESLPSATPINATDFVFILDTSGSMFGQPLADLKTATHQAIDLLPASSEAAIILFNSSAVVAQDFTADRAVLHGVVDGLQASGGTDYSPPLQALLTLYGNRNPARKRVTVFISDGQPNIPTPQSLVQQVADANITVNTVGFGVAILGFTQELENIARTTGGTFYSAPTATELQTIMGGLVVVEETKLLYAYFPFDDGGRHAENYAHLLDWDFAIHNVTFDAASYATHATLYGWTIDNPTDTLPQWWLDAFFYGVEDVKPGDDADGDGLTNLSEFLLGLNPNSGDTDGDRIRDSDEDADGDGITNANEAARGSDPLRVDTDDDGLADSAELQLTTDPADALSPYQMRYIHNDGQGEVEVPGRVARKDQEGARFNLPVWTLESTVRLNRTPTNNVVLIGRYAEPSGHATFEMGIMTNLHPYVRFETGQGLEQKLVGPSMVALNQWVTLGGRFAEDEKADHTQLSLFHDFSESTRTLTDVTPALGTQQGNLVLGRYLPGDIDEVRVWNVARRDDQITALQRRTLLFGADVANLGSLKPNNDFMLTLDSAKYILPTWTISAWVKTGSGGNIIQRDSAGHINYSLGVNAQGRVTSSMDIQMLALVLTGQGDNGPVIETQLLWGRLNLTAFFGNASDGQWHHVATTFDGSILTVYLDGVFCGSATLPASSVTSIAWQSAAGTVVGLASTDFALALDPGAVTVGTGFIDGLIDELVVSGDALSRTEVIASMQTKPSMTSLVGYYDFDDVDMSAGKVVKSRVGSDEGILVGSAQVAVGTDQNAPIRIRPLDILGDKLAAYFPFDDGRWTNAANSVEDFRYRLDWDYAGTLSPSTNSIDFVPWFSAYTNSPDELIQNLYSLAPADTPWRTDSDGDGMPDIYEQYFGFSPEISTDAAEDADDDGLSNLNEYYAHTDPLFWDSDRDGKSDLDEDGDGDGLSNGQEQNVYFTHPGRTDTDDDGIGDLQELVATTDPRDSRSPFVPQALSFGGASDSNNEVVVLDAATGDWPTERLSLSKWTIELMLSPSNVPPAGANQSLIRRIVSSSGGVNYEVGITNRVVSGQPTIVPYARFDVAGTATPVVLLSGQTLSTNAWSHIAARFDGSTFALFVNGQQSIARAISASCATGAGDLVIGSADYEGLLREMRVWSVVRTDTQIRDFRSRTLFFGGAAAEAAYLQVSGKGAVRETTTSQQSGGNPIDNLTGQWTLEAWVKSTAPGVIIARRNTAAQTDDDFNYYLGIGESGTLLGRFALSYYQYVVQNNVVVPIQILDFTINNISGSINVMDGAWHHVAYIRDGASVRLYVDGLLDTSQSNLQVPIGVNVNNPTVRALNGPLVFGENMVGSLDELRVWNRGLSVSELKAGRNSNLTGTELGLVTYINFDLQLGRTADDRSALRDPAEEYGIYVGDAIRVQDALNGPPITTDPVRLYQRTSLVGYFGANDGGESLEDYTHRFGVTPFTGEMYAGRLGGSVSFANLLSVGVDMLTDSDVDGIPDWWESIFGLDPGTATGDDGSWADLDLDGLSNLAEYEAWRKQGVALDPHNPDSLNTGRYDFYGWSTNAPPNQYRIFGEIYTDFDGMEDGWEVSDGLDPRAYDAHRDADVDGWSNRSEFLYDVNPGDGTISHLARPNSNTTWPQPSVNFKIYYTGFRDTGPLRVFTYNAESMDGVPSATFALAGLAGPYPRSVLTTNIVSGHLREGATWFWAFYDVNNDGTWNAGEPAGMARNQPVNIGYSAADAIELDLTESQPNYTKPDYESPGFGRFDWSAVPQANTYKISIRNKSVDGWPVVLTRTVAAPRTFFHEQDYRIAGNPLGLAQAGYEWFVRYTIAPNGTDVLLTNGLFTVWYPPSLATPTLVTPSGIILRRAWNTLQWQEVPGATAYRLQIARDAAFTSIVTNHLASAPIPNAQSLCEMRMPTRAGDAGFGNGVYYWRVQALAMNLVSLWPSARSLTVDLTDNAAGPYSIAGSLVYFGKVTNSVFVVQAFKSRDFALEPFAQTTVANTSQSRSWPTNTMAYALKGLSPGTYFVRAFLDQNNNRLLDDWESVGFVRQNAYIPRALVVPPSLTEQTLPIVFADTDNDRIADDWEYQYNGNLSKFGAGSLRGYTDSDNDGILNDYEMYAGSPMNLNPLSGTAAGLDGVPIRVKSAFGLDPLTELYFDISGITFDSQGRAVIQWYALPGAGTKQGGTGGRATQSNAGVAVQYQVQYSPDLRQWLDVPAQGVVTYDAVSNKFLCVDPPVRNAKSYRYRVFWSF